MLSKTLNALSEFHYSMIFNSLTVSYIWKVSIEKPGSLELMTFLAKSVCKQIYLIEQTFVTMCSKTLKLVLFYCNRNRAYVHRVKLYYFVNIEIQVGVRTLNLLKFYRFTTNQVHVRLC